MSALERILHETEQWFLSEPLFLVVYCSHRLTINPNMRCALRSGQGRIEYNPDLINPMLDIQLRNLLRVEILRILLKHPYSRQPLSCSSEVLKLASDMVITPAYKLESAGPTPMLTVHLTPDGLMMTGSATTLRTVRLSPDGSTSTD